VNARVAFDTHAFVKRLEAAGMSLEQAETFADAMGDVVLPAVAGKPDLQELGHELRGEMRQLGHDLRTETAQLGHDLRQELKDMELRLTSSLTNRMGAMGTLAVAILGVLIALF
jgi:uncharacterized protein YgfB (UPF0149 family)